MSKPDDVVFLDTETTGFESSAEIVELTVLASDGAIILHTLVKPLTEIDESGSAFAVHGITNDMVKNAPSFADILPSLVKALEGKTVVAYNAAFDRRMIGQSVNLCGGLFSEASMSWECASVEYARWRGRRKLSNACEEMGVNHYSQHRSLGDATALCNLVKAMAE